MDSKLTTDSLYLLHLISCALRDTTPSDLPQDASWDVVFQLAERNSVTTTCAFAVAKAPGATDKERSRWQSKVDSNLMRHAIFDIEREQIYKEMDAAGLAHASLKGILTSRAYPRPEMRWMCDNDFLFGKPEPNGTVKTATDEDARELRRIMEHLGYKTEAFGTGNHDSYQKPPFLNFEPHRRLANPEVDWWQYYANPWAHTRKTPPQRLGNPARASPRGRLPVPYRAHVQALLLFRPRRARPGGRMGAHECLEPQNGSRLSKH